MDAMHQFESHRSDFIQALSLKVELLSYKEAAGARYLQCLLHFRRHSSRSKMRACQVRDPGAVPGCRIFPYPVIPQWCSKPQAKNRGVEPRGATPPSGSTNCLRSSAEEREFSKLTVAGSNPAEGILFWPCSPTSRGTRLKIGSVQVRVLSRLFFSKELSTGQACRHRLLSDWSH